jgi:hypothetical protein
MERMAVSSSTIRSVAYDADSGVLEIEFGSGAVYQYSGVPQEEFDCFMASDSKGKYLNANIAKRYPYSRI